MPRYYESFEYEDEFEEAERVSRYSWKKVRKDIYSSMPSKQYDGIKALRKMFEFGEWIVPQCCKTSLLKQIQKR